MAITLDSLKPPKGANRNRKRVGRGIGSGHGKTATRGYKGQKSRSGTSVRPGFEGGQMPLHRRLPKRGFHNIFRKEYAVVNLKSLSGFEAGARVDPETLMDRGIVKNLKAGIKILGTGEIPHALRICAHKFSKGAEEKIIRAGGSIEVIGLSESAPS
jgi:large subunit ribosomal protein L15